MVIIFSQLSKECSLTHIALRPFPVIVAVVVSFFFGAMWYGPLFGKYWAKLMNMDMMSKPPQSSEIFRGMALTIVGSILTSFVMLNNVQVWRPSSWGIEGAHDSKLINGAMTALFMWVGFSVPMCLNTVAWERRSFTLCFLNMAYHFCHLQLIAFVVAQTA
jgi:hypothetical protein